MPTRDPSEGTALEEQQRYLTRITRDLLEVLRGCWIAFTRYPDSGEWLLHRSTDEFLESAIAIEAQAREGVFNPGRRELRYLLEATIKYVYVDQQHPGATRLKERLALVDRIPRSTISPIDDIVLRMQPDPKALRDAAKSQFGALSAFVHVSSAQVGERLRRGSRGEFIGLESAATVRAFNRTVLQTYDVLIALFFEGVGPSFTGDIFVELLDDLPGWVFHKTPFVSLVSQHFDYKPERQRRRGT